MIATILPGSTNFHAVGYNERKVSKGVARLLEIQNFGALGTFGKPTSEELVRYLQEYSSRNSRIQKAQFHVAISCKGHEQSESELLEFAHQYLKEMGYGEAGQPLLVYSHHDTDNTHLHIVTSRIAPDGKKIAHDHERRRSQEVIDRILGTNRKQKTGKDINDAKQYTFSSFAQFKSVMTSMGYETYQKDGIVFIKHGGKVQQKLPLSEIEALYRNGYRDRARCRQLRNILKKYRDVSTNKEELQKEQQKKSRLVLMIPHLAAFTRQIYSYCGEEKEKTQQWEELVGKRRQNVVVIGAYHPQRDLEVYATPLFQSLASCQWGVHLGGNASLQRALEFEGLNFSLLNRSEPPGNGFLKKGSGGGSVQLLIPYKEGEE